MSLVPIQPHRVISAIALLETIPQRERERESSSTGFTGERERESIGGRGKRKERGWVWVWGGMECGKCGLLGLSWTMSVGGAVVLEVQCALCALLDQCDALAMQQNLMRPE